MASGLQFDALRLKSAGVEIVHIVARGTIPGVVFRRVGALNGRGVGRIRIRRQGTVMSWREPGATGWGTDVSVVEGSGTYMLPGHDPAKFVVAQVYEDHLHANAEAEVMLTEVYENAVAQADITAAQAVAGNVLAYSFDMVNVSVEPLHNLRAWVAPGISGIGISTFAGGYTSPTTDATGIVFPTLVGGGTDTIFVQRTIGAAAPSDPAVETALRFAFDTI